MGEAGTKPLSGLERVGIDPTGFVVDESQLTTTKARIIAEGPLRFPHQVHRLAPDVDAVLISDYQDRRSRPGNGSSCLGCRLLSGQAVGR